MLRILLLPLSLIYFLVLKSIYFLYRLRILKKFHPGCPVISIGNITYGGTGKTPIVEFLSKYFKEKGKRVAVLIRGYGRDESLVLKDKLKDIAVLVGRDRIRNSLKAIRDFGAQVIILDDGFQHWRLERDFDILAIDSIRPFGNGLLLPAGELREPLSGLKRSGAFLLTRVDQVEQETFKKLLGKLKDINPDALIVETIHRPLFFYRLDSPEHRLGLDTLRQKEAVLVSSIGNPGAFEKTVKSLGILVMRHFRFSDHYWYRQKDIFRISDFCRFKKVSNIITTEKDAVKLVHGPWSMVHGPAIFVLAIKIEMVKNGQILLDRLNRICSC